jgi:hypothetical protein
MTLHVTIHCKIIQKYIYKIVQIFSECIGNNSMVCWRSILNSKRHHNHIKAPQFITNAILYLFFRAIKIWWYLKYPSKKEYASYLIIVFSISFMKGNGYGSFFVVVFSFLKSIQILSLPFFYGKNKIFNFITWFKIWTEM